MDGYRVNLGELEQITARMRGFSGFLTETLQGLQQRMAALHQTWSGEAATAQSEAFAQWMTAANEVAEGIAAMQDASADAHASYIDAVETNLRTLGLR
ncbi:WXG100 family type VII secretion target [Nocardia sp. XZ_19_385]|uniref:WXG100 family type VII secretion target n=1 Tax=Nocardia sp. XZ_19_385 TaxID=2769488 RepID=UPI00188F9C99|nr:WXG100 family type VII secretion target [Nocardia sp. XZ_19_385]